MRILKVTDKRDKGFLRKKIADFDFSKFSRDETHNLVREMRKAMHGADGIGLASSQIGLDAKVFVAEFEGRFYAIFNPEIVKKSKATSVLEQGCLSIPGETVAVERPDKITVVAYDKNGRRRKFKLTGMFSQIFQHEIDHLHGKLIIDYEK